MLTARQATEADIDLIHRMAQEVFPCTYGEILSRKQVDYMMEWIYSPENILKQMTVERHVYIIAFEGTEPVGYVSLQAEGKDLFHLQKLYILPQKQGTHAGSFLFRKAIEYIKEIHPEPCSMELNVNRHNKAVGFYEHMGMRKIRQGDFPIGDGYFMNDYIMSMDI